MSDETDQEPDADKEHESISAGVKLFGERLQPYTAQRYVLAQSMGLLYPFVGEEAGETLERTGIYPGIWKDAAIAIFVCRIGHASEQTKEQFDAGEWTIERAEIRPAEAKEAAMKWAKENGIFNPYDKRNAEAKLAFQQIVKPVEDAKFNVRATGSQPEPEPKKKDAPSRPNGRGLNAKSQKKRGVV